MDDIAWCIAWRRRRKAAPNGSFCVPKMGSAYFGEHTEFTQNFYHPKRHHLKRAIFRLFLLSGWDHATSYRPSVAHFNNVSVDLSVFSGSLGTYSLPGKMSPWPAHYWLCDIHCLTRSSHRKGRGGGCLGLIELFNSWVMGYVAHTMILFLSANWSTKWISWSLVWWCAVVTLYDDTTWNALWGFFDLL